MKRTINVIRFLQDDDDDDDLSFWGMHILQANFISNAFTVDFLINFESSEYEVMLYEQ